MATVPAPAKVSSQEEWNDSDFDFPEGDALHASDHLFEKDEDEDWDVEMNLTTPARAKAKAVLDGMAARSAASLCSSKMVNIHPPAICTDEEDEGPSTIKFPSSKAMAQPAPIEEDFEDAFALPSELTKLSLAPLSLTHRPSKVFEWGDKDPTSSQSSDAYSSFGFTDASASSNSVTSSSLPCSEAEEDEDHLDGLVIPTGLFETREGGRHLTTILENKKVAPINDPPANVASPDPEDNFEIGLVIDDDDDLSPSRLLLNSQQHHAARAKKRSESLPSRSIQVPRPPSRTKYNRSKSPSNPPPSSARQFQKLRLSPSPPLRAIRSQSFQPLSAPCSSTPSSSSRTGNLRGQKSQPGLKPVNLSGQRKPNRKASLSSLVDTSQPQASGSGLSSSTSSNRSAHYEAPTAASRAKVHTSSVSRLSLGEIVVPPTRPSTPSSNPVALRLTVPTAVSRPKSRPSLSSVFSTSTKLTRSTSPISPSSSLSSRSRKVSPPSNPAPPPAAKILRKPKRQRTYGDGTELDGIEDLPTDREKERRYRVQPKCTVNRTPSGSQSAKPLDTSTIRRKGNNIIAPDPGSVAASASSKRCTRVDFPSKEPDSETLSRKKKPGSSAGPARRKPTLIRNLSGSKVPKVVGEMKWNPKTLRWEGNEQILREFDAAVGTSTRPALITHLTGSSLGSPVNSFAVGARKVGDMMFDPIQMCWLSTLPPEEDEPDVFADLADDEEDGWATKGGTIRANLTPSSATPDPSMSTGSASSFRMRLSPARSHTRTISESSSDRGSRPLIVCDVDDAFREQCRKAEERHRDEMKGWQSRHEGASGEPNRSSLYEIRALATRKY